MSEVVAVDSIVGVVVVVVGAVAVVVAVVAGSTKATTLSVRDEVVL